MARIAYFVSQHGFGHAARACAVMAELVQLRRDLRFDIFTQAPEWFFADSLPECFSYHHVANDVGLVQLSPLIEDIEATIHRLDRASFADHQTVTSVSDHVRAHDPQLVIADISPLGLAISSHLELPSVLIENFTWDWIYRNYPGAPGRLLEHGLRLAEIFARADLRIQTEPECESVSSAVPVGPVARPCRRDRESVRDALGVPVGEPMLTVSMGGVPWDYASFASFEHRDGPWIVVPGGAENTVRREGRLLLLPFHAEIYHPDLVAASDLVVSKLGYSTVAEAHCGGAALAYVERQRFPESPVLARWVETNMVAGKLEEHELSSGAWREAVEGILERPRSKPEGPSGAVQAARVIVERFGSRLE